MASGSTKAILAAMFANMGISIAKFVAYVFTSSSSMLAESIHSVADAGNQALLLWGGKAAVREADDEHQFGYGRERYFWAFVVALVLGAVLVHSTASRLAEEGAPVPRLIRRALEGREEPAVSDAGIRPTPVSPEPSAERAEGQTPSREVAPGMSVEQIREVPLFRQAHDDTLAEGLEDPRMIRHRVVRRIIDRCARDLIGATLKSIDDARVESVADVRGVGQRLVGSSPEMAERVRELKEFLFREMYRHYRVVRMGKKAGQILKDLFQSLAAEPGQLPPRFQAQIERDGLERVVCDYIAGMTDNYAISVYEHLFMPSPWSVR